MKILAVMVRYQTPLAESLTFNGLSNAFATELDLAKAYTGMIWDNSAHAIEAASLPSRFLYCHSNANIGVSGAFNGALRHALDSGYTWMLLLDQDTGINRDFLRTMLRHARELEGWDEIAAIAPTVYVRGYVVSPRRQLFNRHRSYPGKASGIAGGEAFAINSGCLLRVEALRQIGGFSQHFWLDYSDMYVFHQLFLHGKKVWRAADAELEHDMSIMDYDRLMTPSRYRNYSHAESAFNDLYKGRIENAAQTLRLAVRAIKQRKKYKNPEFSRIAWEQFKYRLRVPWGERISSWLAEGEQRAGQEAGAGRSVPQ